MTLKNTLAMLGNSRGVTEAAAKRLLHVTHGCRPDMHEPDEQRVTAKVHGKVFDNAGSDHELSVLLRRDVDDDSCVEVAVNLATLVALARIGAALVLDDGK